MGSHAPSYPLTRAVAYATGNALLAGGAVRNPSILPAGFGVFNETGNAANLFVTTPATFVLAAGTGAFNFTGDAMTPVIAYTLTAAPGVFNETGNNATLTTAGGGGAATYTPLGSDKIDLNFTALTQTFTVDLTGVVSSDILDMGFFNDAGVDFTGITVDGHTATNDLKTTDFKGQAWRCTGITGGPGKLVVVTAAGAISDLCIAFGKSSNVTNLTPSGGAAKIDFGFVDATGRVLTVTVPTGGHAIAYYGGNNAHVSHLPLAWTGATRDAVTENHVDTGNGGDIGSASTTSTGSVTITETATSTDFCGNILMVVSRGP